MLVNRMASFFFGNALQLSKNTFLEIVPILSKDNKKSLSQKIAK